MFNELVMLHSVKLWFGVFVFSFMLFLALCFTLIFLGVGVPECDVACEVQREQAKDFQHGKWISYESLPDGVPCFIRVTQWRRSNGNPMNTETQCGEK